MSDADQSKAEPTGASLCTFAVDLYGAPGVAEACLALQDRHRCDVNVVLFAAWMGAVHRRAIMPDEMAEAVASIQGWHAEIVGPLRSARRRLKSGPPPAPDASSEALRARIKGMELEAERIELAALERFAATWHAGPGGQHDGHILANLTTAIRCFAGGEPAPEARELIGTIENGLTHMSAGATE